VDASVDPNGKSLEVPTDGCGCGGAKAYDAFKGTQEQGRALSQTRLGRLILSLRGFVEHLLGR